ncbi:MAG: BON domain-containing protein [Betaproteobacteria bacterium]|nr:BON domain-containing protein [Betaproteobacteria bacterium]MDE2004623.1 BON domain-containing protein [Betaproteobacteria bacterium]MDE2209702.1 BON domain-containing protein [Betaproteobacteria bacterium]MDE2358406.1 BON domain-containing protein [Betaproteobacteria bacterium]
MNRRSLFAAFAAIAIASALLAGCAPILVAGAVGGTALVATDRRSAGAQLDDESIELKIANNIGAGYGDQVHVNVTSYNGIVLLTGEVPTQDSMNAIVEIARKTPKVRTVHNELLIGPVSSIGSRTNDSYITAKVKSRFVEANKFAANHVKVVTERQVVYLMGLVRHSEADTAAQIAATTSGVTRVVKLFQYID